MIRYWIYQLVICWPFCLYIVPDIILITMVCEHIMRVKFILVTPHVKSTIFYTLQKGNWCTVIEQFAQCHTGSLGFSDEPLCCAPGLTEPLHPQWKLELLKSVHRLNSTSGGQGMPMLYCGLEDKWTAEQEMGSCSTTGSAPRPGQELIIKVARWMKTSS